MQPQATHLCQKLLRALSLMIALWGVQLWLTPTPIALADTIAEVEPNNDAEHAQLLPAIGLSNPVSASISPAGDTDWYKFEVVVGRTYIIEVYNLNVGLGRDGGGRCESNRDYMGLGLIIYGVTGSDEIARQCSPNASGNMQNSLWFTANASGYFYLRVLANSSATNVFGSYFLRILPHHDQPSAEWDNQTFEPNNRLPNAYEIIPGLNNALTSTIEARNIAYATSFVDIDTYRIKVVQGRTYVVELFNVDLDLTSDGGATCESNRDYRGLAMGLYRPNYTFVYQECDPRGIGDVHNFLEFKAELNGLYYVRIYPNANTNRIYGTYHIRVLPKYDEPDAVWDSTTFEPNNRQTNAYSIQIGRFNAISSTLEARSLGYSTSFTDIDWYYFHGEADQVYVVELFNVETSLGASGGANCESNRDYKGLALFIYSPVTTGRYAGQCNPAGRSNVHSIAAFTANADGDFGIVVYANSSNVSGSYQLRVLPAYNQPAASWDIGLEPNNNLATSYPLQVNPCGVFTAIDPRRPSFLTNNTDLDWYVFNASKDEQYKLALSEIEATLQNEGLYLQLHDREGTRLQQKHGRSAVGIDFTAGYTGPYYAVVYPEANSSGSYRISVSKTLTAGCNGEAAPPAAVQGALSTAPTEDGRIAIVVPRGNRTLTLTIRTRCSVAQNVQLFVGSKVFTMIRASDSLYQKTLNLPQDLPTSGSLEINAQYTCDGELYIVAIAPTLEFHDPSGQITDLQSGLPITGAVVTLYRIQGALPDSNGQTRDCRTIDTRGGSDWSKLPAADPLSGERINPLDDVLKGIQQIQPQANPQVTGDEGRYAWDVVEGCWYVVVTAPGYATVISPLVGVPPAVTDLNLKMEKRQEVYLPLVQR